MIINASGWEDDDERALIEDFVGYCIEDQLPNIETHESPLVIDVIADNNLIKERKWGDIQICGWFNTTPTYFRMRIRRSGVPLHKQLVTLGHECVHIRHYREDGLEQIGDTVFRFRGQEIDVSLLKNWKEPWELEARGETQGLIENYLDALGYHGDQKPDWYIDSP